MCILVAGRISFVPKFWIALLTRSSSRVRNPMKLDPVVLGLSIDSLSVRGFGVGILIISPQPSEKEYI